MFLALFAAVMHAVFGALQKGRHDPWLSRGAIDFCYGVMAAPFAFFVVPWPEPHMWLIFAGMLAIHVIYKITQGMAYAHGAYTVVYPVVRGLGPLVTVIAAGFVFGERFAMAQWGGVLLLTLSILALAGVNLSRETRVNRSELRLALMWAVLGGVMVAAYTTYDAYGIRATADPFTFLAWFFFIDGLVVFPWVALTPLAQNARAPRNRPLDDTRFYRRDCCIFKLWFHHDGNKAGQCGRSGGIEGNFTGFCGVDRLVFPKRNGWANTRYIDGFNCTGCGICGIWRLK